MSSFSIDQARQASLACSLTHLANQQHNLELEMVAIQQMRLKLREAFNAVPQKKVVGTIRGLEFTVSSEEQTQSKPRLVLR
ncbi:hypothetical protein [Nitrobacter sp. TKz-YC02]|uniref:hypothetical protein n=1 Tax=Nitrobacter sp. TKz-YC02 TaxID=3398704 RepID=UPI003CF91E95